MRLLGCSFRFRTLGIMATVTFIGTFMLVMYYIDPGTKYAPGYREVNFRRIDIGDSKEHVKELLGEPIRIVGDLFIYRYLDLQVNFEVNRRTGYVRIKNILGGRNLPPEIEKIDRLQQLVDVLGQPDLIVGAQGGQSGNSQELTCIYSKKSGWWPSWNYRLVYVHKQTGFVTRKLATKMSKF